MAAYDKSNGERLWRTEWDDTCLLVCDPADRRQRRRFEIVFAHSGKIAAYAALTGERLWQFPYEINQMVSSPASRAT